MTIPASDFRQMVVMRRDSCVKFKDGKPSRDRNEALRFYRGDNLPDYGDSGDGLSTVVSRDTMEAVESMMPSLIRPFVAGEEVVSFDPTGPEDEDGAAQATDYVNFVFTTHNNPFRVVHDSMKDGLMFRLGVAKTVMEEEEQGGPETYDGLSDEELAAAQAAAQQARREIVGPIAQDENGLYSITLAPRKAKRYRVHIIAPDEFLYEERLASLYQATFLGHTKQMPLGDLIALGIDEKKAMKLKSGPPPRDGQERDQRFDASESEPDEWADDDLARPVWVDECYIKCDYGNGPEWRKALLGGSQSDLLLDEPAGGHPYSAWTPVPVPHKLVGLSIHDLTRDVQLNKTALQRELNNAMYLANRPMREVVDGQVNIDDLLNPRVGGVVRVKSQGAITPIPSGGEAAFSAGLSMIEYMDSVREARTGVTRYNQGMDANSLNKTATGMNIISNASQQRQELVARQYAEFLKDIFRKLLQLVSQHGEKGDVIRLRGKWVEVDPTDWKTNYDMSVSVGLGTNNKDQLVNHIMMLLQLDQSIVQLQGGVDGPILTAQNIYEKLKSLVSAVSLKGVDKYYTDPADAPPAPPQPDENEQDAQTELQKEAIRAKAKTDSEVIRGQFGVAKEAAAQPVIVPPMDGGLVA